jgi:hypothetical protein
MRAIQGGCLTLWLLASSSLWAAAPAQQYQQLRSQATLLAVNALLYFDADPRAQPDARHLSTLREAQQRLDALALQLDLLPGWTICRPCAATRHRVTRSY